MIACAITRPLPVPRRGPGRGDFGGFHGPDRARPAGVARPASPRRLGAPTDGRAGHRLQRRTWRAEAVAGMVRNVPAGDFQNLVNEGYIVLDVRPHTEREKAPLVNAVEVPLFVPDAETSLSRR